MSNEQQAQSLKQYETYKNWTEINKFNLDEEVTHQSSLHQQIGDEWAQAQNMRDLAEVNIEIVKATLDGQLREDPDIGHITEPRIKNLVTSHPKTVAANQEYLSWKYIANLWASLASSFRKRYSMLERLCELDARGYYERPSVSVKGEARYRLAEQVKQEQTQHRLRQQERRVVGESNEK